MPIYARTNMTGAITDEDLAYLNANLDIVTNYLHAMCTRSPQFTHLAVRAIARHRFDFLVNIYTDKLTAIWTSLLKYVKEHADDYDARPFLK